MMEYIVVTEVKETALFVIPLWEDQPIVVQAKNMRLPLAPDWYKRIPTVDWVGKNGESLFFYTDEKKYSRVLLVGLGNQKEGTIRHWKQAVGSAVIFAESKKITELTLVIPGAIVKEFGLEWAGQETAIAGLVADYAFDEHKSIVDSKVTHLKKVQFFGSFDPVQRKNFSKGVTVGMVIGKALNHARDLGNTPPSIMTPTLLAKEAIGIARRHKKMTVKILSRPDMVKLGMGCLLGVAQGSVQEPKFIILEYIGTKKSAAPTVLTGKGITYDSGGLSLKPRDALPSMKFDMLGAATVLGAMNALAELDVKKNIVAIIPACENMPSGSAYRPDDILTAMNGTTVEIGNTDAEGRLVLAEALSYAAKYSPKEVINFATLTGHSVVALGTERSALFSPEEGMVKGLAASAERVGELLWRMPLGEEYTEAIKSDVADIKNVGGVGGSTWGGGSIAAAFLQHFTTYPFAHIDMACCIFEGKGKPWIRGGANGYGVELVVEYLRG